MKIRITSGSTEPTEPQLGLFQIFAPATTCCVKSVCVCVFFLFACFFEDEVFFLHVFSRLVHSSKKEKHGKNS